MPPAPPPPPEPPAAEAAEAAAAAPLPLELAVVDGLAVGLGADEIVLEGVATEATEAAETAELLAIAVTAAGRVEAAVLTTPTAVVATLCTS